MNTQVIGALDVTLATYGAPAGHRFRGARLVRLLDIVIALTGLIVFLPLMGAIAVVLASGGGPVLFRQQRLGRDGALFSCLKFRSMVVDAEHRLARLLREDGAARAEWMRSHKLRDDPRITRFGEFLRKSSLDELPQLFNIVRGEMSVVGPRPIVPAEAARYRHYLRHYCAIRPGLTGLWQVSGRSDVSYRRRIALDVAYARHASPAVYLGIVARTVPAVLMQRGSR